VGFSVGTAAAVAGAVAIAVDVALGVGLGEEVAACRAELTVVSAATSVAALVGLGDPADGGVALSSAASDDASVALTAAVLQDVLAKTFRTAPTASEDVRAASAGVDRGVPSEAPVLIGRNATKAAITRASPEITRLWRTFRASVVVSAPSTKGNYGQAVPRGEPHTHNKTIAFQRVLSTAVRSCLVATWPLARRLGRRSGDLAGGPGSPVWRS
jgi:hypothetical protein